MTVNDIYNSIKEVKEDSNSLKQAILDLINNNDTLVKFKNQIDNIEKLNNKELYKLIEELVIEAENNKNLKQNITSNIENYKNSVINKMDEKSCYTVEDSSKAIVAKIDNNSYSSEDVIDMSANATYIVDTASEHCNLEVYKVIKDKAYIYNNSIEPKDFKLNNSFLCLNNKDIFINKKIIDYNFVDFIKDYNDKKAYFQDGYIYCDNINVPIAILENQGIKNLYNKKLLFNIRMDKTLRINSINIDLENLSNASYNLSIITYNKDTKVSENIITKDKYKDSIIINQDVTDITFDLYIDSNDKIIDFNINDFTIKYCVEDIFPSTVSFEKNIEYTDIFETNAKPIGGNFDNTKCVLLKYDKNLYSLVPEEKSICNVSINNIKAYDLNDMKFNNIIKFTGNKKIELRNIENTSNNFIKEDIIDFFDNKIKCYFKYKDKDYSIVFKDETEIDLDGIIAKIKPISNLNSSGFYISSEEDITLNNISFELENSILENNNVIIKSNTINNILPVFNDYLYENAIDVNVINKISKPIFGKDKIKHNEIIDEIKNFNIYISGSDYDNYYDISLKDNNYIYSKSNITLPAICTVTNDINNFFKMFKINSSNTSSQFVNEFVIDVDKTLEQNIINIFSTSRNCDCMISSDNISYFGLNDKTLKLEEDIWFDMQKLNNLNQLDYNIFNKSEKLYIKIKMYEFGFIKDFKIKFDKQDFIKIDKCEILSKGFNLNELANYKFNIQQDRRFNLFLSKVFNKRYFNLKKINYVGSELEENIRINDHEVDVLKINKTCYKIVNNLNYNIKVKIIKNYFNKSNAIIDNTKVVKDEIEKMNNSIEDINKSISKDTLDVINNAINNFNLNYDYDSVCYDTSILAPNEIYEIKNIDSIKNIQVYDEVNVDTNAQYLINYNNVNLNNFLYVNEGVADITNNLKLKNIFYSNGVFNNILDDKYFNNK